MPDPGLELYRGISDAELLRAHRLFVAEGRLIVRRVLEDRRYRVHSVLVNDAARRELADVLDGAREVPIVVAATEQFVELTGFNIHRGCLALVHRPPDAEIDDLLAPPRLGSGRAPRLRSGQAPRLRSGQAPRLRSGQARGTLLALDAVADADNVGGLFRSAAAFGASGVILSPTSCDPLYRKAIRTSMGAALRMPFVRATDWPQELAVAKRRGVLIAALTPREPAECLDLFASRVRGRNVALVVGAEGAGVSPAIEAMADARVRIPMVDGIDSLNVAVAGGIALYALSRRT